MAEERKGILTPEQEKILDDVMQFKGVAEKIDGLAIQVIDNQGLERLKQQMEEKYPGCSEEYVYPVVDSLMAIVAELAPQNEEEDADIE